jgi:hypothetical protein
MRKSILQRKKIVEYRQISIKIAIDLHDRINAFKERLERIDPDWMFNVSGICQEALEAALKQGEKELEAIEQAKASAGSGIPAQLPEPAKDGEHQEQQPGILATGT